MFIQKKVRKFLYFCMKPFKLNILFLFLLGSLWPIEFNLKPVLLKKVINGVSSVKQGSGWSFVNFDIVLYSLIVLVMFALFRVFDYIWLNTKQPLVQSVAEKLISRVLNHSLHYLKSSFSGSLASRVQSVSADVPDLLHLIVHDFFSHFLAFAGSLISFYFVSPYLSMILMCFLIIFFVVSYYFSKLLSKMSALSAEERSISMGAVTDVFANISNVKIFSSNEKEQGFISRTISRFVVFAQKRQLTFNWVYAFQGVCFSFYQILCLIFLVKGYDAGFITYGDFALVMTVNTTLIRCLWGVAMDLSKFAEYCGNIDQNVSAILKTPDVLDAKGAQELSLDKADIEFKDVVFKYGGKVVFDNLNLKIKAGQKVGIVGFSGAGKSTFLSILLRLFEIDSGSVKIGGVDISKVSQASLRSNFSVVPQEASLFNRTILENINYGLDCDKVKVIAAAKKAMVHDEILEMQGGYDFKVGQGGSSISGGQRQRIAIARAFLRQSPILVLDEATSALDMFLEKKVKGSIDELMEGKTVIAIAHRLSMLVSMDRILVFDAGKIIEDGSHEDLVSKSGGLYAKLWENFNGNSWFCKLYWLFLWTV